MDFSDLVAFVDREARIVTNPVFGRISDSVKPPSGQRSSGGKTALKRPENLSFITQVDGCECPPSETQVNQALMITENRVRSLARYNHPVIIPFPPAKGVSVSIVTVTMPLKIVCHCDGNQEFSFWRPTNCFSGASPISIFQGSALRERPVKLQTVHESILPFFTPVLVRDIQQTSVLAQKMTLTFKFKFVAAW